MSERNPMARLLALALELAETGQFQNTFAVERELAAAGFAVADILTLERPGIRMLIDGACQTGRGRHKSLPSLAIH